MAGFCVRAVSGRPANQSASWEVRRSLGGIVVGAVVAGVSLACTAPSSFCPAMVTLPQVMTD